MEDNKANQFIETEYQPVKVDYKPVKNDVPLMKKITSIDGTDNTSKEELEQLEHLSVKPVYTPTNYTLANPEGLTYSNGKVISSIYYDNKGSIIWHDGLFKESKYPTNPEPGIYNIAFKKNISHLPIIIVSVVGQKCSYELVRHDMETAVIHTYCRGILKNMAFSVTIIGDF